MRKKTTEWFSHIEVMQPVIICRCHGLAWISAPHHNHPVRLFSWTNSVLNYSASVLHHVQSVINGTGGILKSSAIVVHFPVSLVLFARETLE